MAPTPLAALPVKCRQQAFDVIRQRRVGVRLLKEWSVAELAGLLRHSRNTRSQDNSDRRIIRSNPRSEHEPVDAPPEVDIRKQYLDRFSASENRLRLFTGPRLQNAVSAFAKKIGNRQANENFVFHHQNRRGSGVAVPRPSGLVAFRGPRLVILFWCRPNKRQSSRHGPLRQPMRTLGIPDRSPPDGLRFRARGLGQTKKSPGTETGAELGGGGSIARRRELPWPMPSRPRP